MGAQANSSRTSSVTPTERVALFSLTFVLVAAVGFALELPGFDDIAGFAAATGIGWGGWLLLRYGRTADVDDAGSFRLFGAAFVLGASGMALVAVVAEITVVPAFGTFDLIFLTMYAMLLTGLATFPAIHRGWRSRARVLVDGMVGAVSLATLLWSGPLNTIFEGLSDLPTNQRVIGTVYPLLDVALLVGVMLVILRRGTHHFDVRLLALAMVFGFQAAADLSYLSSSPTGSFNDAEPNLLLFLGTATSVLAAGLLVGRRPAPVETTDRATPLWSYAIPYVLGVSMVVVHLVESVTKDDGTPLFQFATLIVMFLVIARQSLAIHENRTKVDLERRSLIASVSHELRTPLTSLIGFLTILNDAGEHLPPNERRELSEVVLDQANYMGRVVTDIVLLARDTPEKLTLSESPIELSELAASVLDTVGSGSTEIDVRVDPAATVRVDADRVKQVAVNLLTNAVRYGSGQALLVLEVRAADLVIEVHDNGPGVPKKYQQSVWERFERGSNQLNSNIPGTGLGLAIVEMIAKAHRGYVGYRTSEKLGGACFTVTLPGRAIDAETPLDSDVTPFSLPVSSRFQ